MGGYYAVFWFLRLHTDQQLDSRLDSNEYDPDETIEIRIPVSLPYPIHTSEFERVDGRFEHQGQFFKLVKHRFQHDTLYIVCIRDHQTRELVNTMNDYVELTQAVPGTNQKAWNFLSKLIKDYHSGTGIAVVHHPGFSMHLLFSEKNERCLKPLLPVHAPPPKA